MSSFRVKRNVDKLCFHCAFKYPYHKIKCSRCNLWGFGIPKRRIPKKDYLYNIKNIYVINLQKDRQRLVSFFNNIKKQQIPTNNRKWSRYNAIDGTQENIIHAEAKALSDNKNLKEKIMSHWEKYPGSIGCYFSHIKLWQHIYNDEKSGEYVLIMEDDSFFTPNGMINVELALGMAKKLKWDLLYAGHNLLKGQKTHPLFLKPYVAKPCENNIGFNSGLFGYIIRKKSIPKLLNIVKAFSSPFIDVQIRNSFGDGPDEISALFIISNLIRHSNTGGSSRKNIDKYLHP